MDEELSSKTKDGLERLLKDKLLSSWTDWIFSCKSSKETNMASNLGRYSFNLSHDSCNWWEKSLSLVKSFLAAKIASTTGQRRSFGSVQTNNWTFRSISIKQTRFYRVVICRSQRWCIHIKRCWTKQSYKYSRHWLKQVC